MLNAHFSYFLWKSVHYMVKIYLKQEVSSCSFKANLSTHLTLELAKQDIDV